MVDFKRETNYTSVMEEREPNVGHSPHEDPLLPAFQRRPGESEFDWVYRTMRQADAPQSIGDGCIGCAFGLFAIGYAAYEIGHATTVWTTKRLRRFIENLVRN